jgi:hypothetical protein
MAVGHVRPHFFEIDVTFLAAIADVRFWSPARERNPRWERGMGMIPDPRQTGDGDGDYRMIPDPQQIGDGDGDGDVDGPPIPGKSGIGGHGASGDDPRL